MASSDKLKDLGQRDAPPILMIVGGIVLAVVIGIGGFVAYNGGWKTTGQQQYEYQHETLPLYAAKHGNHEALDAENKLRKERGEAPLEAAPEKAKVNDPGAFKKLQEQLRAKGAGQ